MNNAIEKNIAFFIAPSFPNTFEFILSKYASVPICPILNPEETLKNKSKNIDLINKQGMMRLNSYIIGGKQETA